MRAYKVKTAKKDEELTRRAAGVVRKDMRRGAALGGGVLGLLGAAGSANRSLKLSKLLRAGKKDAALRAATAAGIGGARGMLQGGVAGSLVGAVHGAGRRAGRTEEIIRKRSIEGRKKKTASVDFARAMRGSIKTAGLNPHVVDVHFRQELEKIAFWGLAAKGLGALGRGLGGASRAFGGRAGQVLGRGAARAGQAAETAALRTAGGYQRFADAGMTMANKQTLAKNLASKAKLDTGAEIAAATQGGITRLPKGAPGARPKVPAAQQPPSAPKSPAGAAAQKPTTSAADAAQAAPERIFPEDRQLPAVINNPAPSGQQVQGMFQNLGQKVDMGAKQMQDWWTKLSPEARQQLLVGGAAGLGGMAVGGAAF